MEQFEHNVFDVVATDADNPDDGGYVLMNASNEVTANFYSALLQHVTFEFAACRTLEEQQKYLTKIML